MSFGGGDEALEGIFIPDGDITMPDVGEAQPEQDGLEAQEQGFGQNDNFDDFFQAHEAVTFFHFGQSLQTPPHCTRSSQSASSPHGMFVAKSWPVDLVLASPIPVSLSSQHSQYSIHPLSRHALQS